MKAIYSLLAATILMTGCGVNRQIQEAKTLGDCKYAVGVVDSVYVAGYDVEAFRDINGPEDINPLKYPRLATSLLAKNVPLSARLYLDVTNPTNRPAALNQLEYRILLVNNEFANGTINQRIEVAPNGGKTRVPILLNTNVYRLLTDQNTRSAFVGLIRNLAGDQRMTPTTVTLKVKPTMTLGNKVVRYPGFITVDKQITSTTLSERKALPDTLNRYP